MFFSYAACLLAISLPIGSLGADVSFDYDPTLETGPGSWHKLAYDESNPNQCAMKENSPIAIEDMGCKRFEDYIMRPGSCTNNDVEFSVNDHGVKATFTGSCERPSLEIPGIDGVFDAVQFHIHTGSEHTVDGVTFGAEMHIVHLMQDCPEGTQRCFAVVGTKLNPASAHNNPLFSIFLEGWIKVHNEKENECSNNSSSASNVITYDEVTHENTLIDPYQFNRGNRFFHYAGGLTTPPCSQVVWWNLDDKPLPISVEQYIDLGRIILNYKGDDCKPATVAYHGSTSRPTQPLYDRTVTKICPKAYAPHVTNGDIPFTEKRSAEAPTSSAAKAASTATFVSPLAVLIIAQII